MIHFEFNEKENEALFNGFYFAIFTKDWCVGKDFPGYESIMQPEGSVSHGKVTRQSGMTAGAISYSCTLQENTDYVGFAYSYSSEGAVRKMTKQNFRGYFPFL